MIEDSRFADGERFQRELFNFTVYVDNSPISSDCSRAERELIQFRRQVQERLRLGKYELRQSGHYSPADLSGMDYVLYSSSLNRFHFIDVTTDVVIKWSLPRLRRDSIFRIELDDTGTVTLECKRAFLERLLTLATSPSLFTMNECGFPSLQHDISPRDAAAELDSFRERLKTRIDFFRNLARSRKEQAAEFSGNAELIKEYWLDLQRLKTFAKWEDERQTDPMHLIQQSVFEKWASTAAPNAVREVITPGSQPMRSSLSTHRVEFESARDQIVLFVQGKRFRLGSMTAFIARATEKVWSTKKMRPDLYPRKAFSVSGVGQKQSIDQLVRLMETTPIPILLGDTFPLPTPSTPVFKPGCKRFGAHGRRP